MKVLSVFFLAAIFMSLSVFAETEVVNVSPEKASTLLSGGKSPTVIDVRTADEFAEGHIKGAVNIDVKAPDFGAKVAKLDKKKSYLIHCRSGTRSSRALKTFEKLGFEHMYHLDKGMLSWLDADQPVETGK